MSDLVWYHAYQYGIGAALGACGLYALYHRLGSSTEGPGPGMTVLHAVAAGGGLAYLASTGKLLSVRSDWPGNVIFTAGGITIVALCVIALRSQSALRKI